MKIVHKTMRFFLAAALCFTALAGCGENAEPAQAQPKEPALLVTNFDNPENAKYSDFEPLLTGALTEMNVTEKPVNVKIGSAADANHKTAVNIGFEVEGKPLLAKCQIQQTESGPKYTVNWIGPNQSKGKPHWINGRPFETRYDFHTGKPLMPPVGDVKIRQMLTLYGDLEDMHLRAAEIRSNQGTNLVISIKVLNIKSVWTSDGMKRKIIGRFHRFVSEFSSQFRKSCPYPNVLIELKAPDKAYATVRLEHEEDGWKRTLTVLANETRDWDYIKRDFYSNPSYGEYGRGIYRDDGTEPVRQFLPPPLEAAGVWDRDDVLCQTICWLLGPGSSYYRTYDDYLINIPVSNEPDTEDLRNAYHNVTRVAEKLLSWDFSNCPIENLSFNICNNDNKTVLYTLKMSFDIRDPEGKTKTTGLPAEIEFHSDYTDMLYKEYDNNFWYALITIEKEGTYNEVKTIEQIRGLLGPDMTYEVYDDGTHGRLRLFEVKVANDAGPEELKRVYQAVEQATKLIEEQKNLLLFANREYEFDITLENGMTIFERKLSYNEKEAKIERNDSVSANYRTVFTG